MGFDLASILMAALAGAIGGGLGVLIARLFTKGKRLSISIIVAVAVLSTNFLAPVLDVQFGEQLREAMGQPTVKSQVAKEFEKLKENALFERVFRDSPEYEELALQRLTLAYQEGGTTEFNNHAYALGFEISQTALPNYLPYSTDTDVLGFLNATLSMTEHLRDTNPQMCFNWLFGSARGADFDSSAFQSSVGPANFSEFNDALSALVGNSLDDPVAYDSSRSEEIISAASLAMQEQAGDVGIALIAGDGLPKNDSDARLACAGVAALYQHVTTYPEAEAAGAFRHMMTQL